jgi:hypothetical protein
MVDGPDSGSAVNARTAAGVERRYGYRGGGKL